MGLKDRATRIGMQWLEGAMRDPEKAERLAKAMMAWQKGRESLKTAQREMLHTVGLPSQEDVAGLGRRLSQVRKRVKATLARVDRLPKPSA